MNENEYDILEVDEEFSPIITEEDCDGLQPLVKSFVKCYSENKDKPVAEWLEPKMQAELPEKSPEVIKAMTNGIIASVEMSERKKKSLWNAISNGRSKESWFADEIKNATSASSGMQTKEYLENLESAVNKANDSLYDTVMTQAGAVSQNPCLDGFIAEQYHAQTFNMNAEAVGSQYRAEVLVPEGTAYRKNSVDVVIKDGSGKIVKRYQSKYCKDAKATAEAFEKGDYRGQQKLVPDGQQKLLSKKSTNVIESPDGVKSNPLKKSEAKRMQKEAQQSGKAATLDWNEYKTKDIAKGIGKKAGFAAILAAGITTGIDIVKKKIKGEKIEADEVIADALESGADAGVKAAAAGALVVGVEKGIVRIIPKGTPVGTIANIAYVAIEDAKVMYKVAKGEYTIKEGFEKLEETTVSTAAGLVAMGKGAAIGAEIGTALGPVGIAVGGVIGGTVGYIAGSKVGEAVTKGYQKVRDVCVSAANEIGKGIVNAAKTVGNAAKNALQSAADKVGSFIGKVKGLFA